MMRVTWAAGFVVACLLALAQTAGAATWTTQPVPPPLATNGTLLGVSCTGTTCEAVGSNLDSSGRQVTLAEKWTGSAWTRQSIPNPTGDPQGNSFNELTSISCSAANACTALDLDTSAYLFGAAQIPAERWNGTAWSAQTITLPSGEYGLLNAISCSSVTSCTAVGSYGSQGADMQHSLVEHWNGTTWQAQSAPLSGYTQVFLNDVSCRSATACVAVGATVNSSSQKVALADIYNGTTWVAKRPATLSGATSSLLNGVSCTAATTCVAVGQASGSTGLGEKLNGTTWTAKAVSGASDLLSVSCSAATACSAVAGPGSTVERWNGSTWAAQTAASVTPAATLVGISCAGAAACTAVGATGDGFHGAARSVQQRPASALVHGASPAPTSRAARVGERSASISYQGGEGVSVAEAWNGSAWKRQVSLNPTGAGSVDVGAVSCAASTTACVLVGTYWNVGAQQDEPLSEVKTSSGWGLVSVPAQSGLSGFNGVSCTAANSCLAVGINGYQGLYGKWNGTSWTTGIIPAPSGDYALDLLSVSCRTASSCEAVGDASGSSGQVAIAEGWNGTTWTRQSLYVPAATSSVLASISCVSTGPCQAAGSYSTSSGTQPLAPSWDGYTWSTGPVPIPSGATGAALYGASCKTGTACTVVGEWQGPGAAGGLADRFNGTSWTNQTPPSTPVLWQLIGVSCATTTACTTVATTASSDWSGTSWGPAQSYAAPTDGGAATIDSIRCIAAQSCIAAGSSLHLLASQIPLVEGYS
jgi:hypothetical protein